MKTNLIVFIALTVVLLGCGPNYTESTQNDITTVVNKNGAILAYSTQSGVKIITDDRLAFKDLNKNDLLDPYEDWRLSFKERAHDLASKLSIEEIAGLMLYSRHQSIPARSAGYFAGTYNGKPYTEGETDPASLTDQQKDFLKKDHLRHILITTVLSPETAARWNNNLQAYVEGLGWGIPANNSSDPRHGTNSSAEYNAGAGGEISMWPGSLGLAATFNPALVEEFGQIASIEYRALGITTALSPQIDIATDPRWYRTSGTFGEDPKLAAAMAQAYIDGFQTSGEAYETADGWGFQSVNAMVKHWPGGGSGEGGRDAHYGAGKYAVYPGNNFEEHLIPFTEGAFKLKGKTKMASAVMPYYTISWEQDTKNNENVGNAYNQYLIQDLLRDKYGYDGVVCTDWSVTNDETALNVFLTGKSWGVENLTVAERHYKVLMAGGDQFGGNNEMAPILEAYQMGVDEHGEKWMRSRMEESAVRLLKNIFRTGLFENPYLQVEETVRTVGKPEFMDKGYAAQLQSVVLLKNNSKVLPIPANKKVFIPKKYYPASVNFLGIPSPAKTDYPINIELAAKYFDVTEDAAQADYALVFMESPQSGIGYDTLDLKTGGNGYVPISLQYNPYTATGAREVSIAGGDPLENFTNRSYKGKTRQAENYFDLEMLKETVKQMKGKPVIVVLNLQTPMIFSEFEADADGILVGFDVQHQAFFDILTGKAEPSGLLPMQMPANMQEVENQMEDVPHDMKVYVDSNGNAYDFAFGMNWQGVIDDQRVATFKRP